MIRLKKLAVLAIALHFFIIIGVGQGIACMGLLEIVGVTGFYGIGNEDFSFSLIGSYERSLMAAGLFTLTGHFILISSLFIKDFYKKCWLNVAGFICLLLSFYYVAHNLFTDNTSLISFLSGLSFIICATVLCYRLKKREVIVE